MKRWFFNPELGRCRGNGVIALVLIFIFGIYVTAQAGADGTASENEKNTEEIIVEALDESSGFEYYIKEGIATYSNGVKVNYRGSVLTAKTVVFDQSKGLIHAEGDVCLISGGQIWRAQSINWDYKNQKLQGSEIRAGHDPFYVGGLSLQADISNNVYTVKDAYVTTDNYSEPAQKIKTKRLKIVPGQYFEAYDAVLYVNNVPTMYFPYYRRRLDKHTNYFTHTPGYRGKYGAYLLNSYNWYLNENVDGALCLDYRTRRGVGLGSDLNLHLGKLGETELQYYYLNDDMPGVDQFGNPISNSRQRFSFAHRTTLSSNTIAKIIARYQSDQFVIRDFYEPEYRKNAQPASYFELNHQWQNFGLDVMAQPRLNDFFETVERLPDIKLTGYRQQLGESPFYYESESSAGWFRRKYANDTQPDFAAWRADTFHQILIPQTYYGWLNIAPRAGGRFTAYSEATGNGATTRAQNRWVFNTGIELSTKASRLWQDAHSKLLDVDGIRHIIQPVINYVYVPSPSKRPPELPQFDYEVYGYRPLPIDYPDYNAIDSIDSQNVIRFSLWNRLQTKRKNEIENLLEWDVFTDWRLSPRPDQATFADLFSQLDIRPRSHIILSQETRYDLNRGYLRELNHRLTILPNDVWSVTIGNRYLRADPRVGSPLGQNIYYTSFYYKFNENWGFRMSHHFEARDGRMEEQYYSVYRDLRSWTAAITLRIRSERTGPDDFTIALTLSLKAFPRFKLGQDADQQSLLLGG